MPSLSEATRKTSLSTVPHCASNTPRSRNSDNESKPGNIAVAWPTPFRARSTVLSVLDSWPLTALAYV